MVYAGVSQVNAEGTLGDSQYTGHTSPVCPVFTDVNHWSTTLWSLVKPVFTCVFQWTSV